MRQVLKEETRAVNREKCYNCYRPRSTCMCRYITEIKTNTRFVILMHPKEFRKTKNGTGHFTNLSLKNCELHVGVNFTQHAAVNTIINDPKNQCYVLYPSTHAINLNSKNIVVEEKQTVIFLIDSTWPCSRALLKQSPNINALEKVSFTHTKSSAFKFKEQPNEYSLSTMESTLCLLELLSEHGVENLKLENFLLPFEKMVEYQVGCIEEMEQNAIIEKNN